MFFKQTTGSQPLFPKCFWFDKRDKCYCNISDLVKFRTITLVDQQQELSFGQWGGPVRIGGFETGAKG